MPTRPRHRIDSRLHGSALGTGRETCASLPRRRAPALRVRLACVVVVLTGAGLPESGDAAPPRLRTLKYDPQTREHVDVPPPATGTPEGELYAIRTRIKEGEYRRALSQVKRFVKRHGEQHPLYPEALLARAEAWIASASYDKAHELLLDFLDRFGGTRLTDEALRMEFVIAEAYLGGARRKVARILRFSGVDTAYEILDRISTDYPDTELAEFGIKTKADHLFQQGSYGLAQLEYARLLRSYPASRYHQHALRRTADAALATFGGVAYDLTPLLEAEERFRQYRARYRVAAEREGIDAILVTIRARRADKDYEVGAYYERTEHLSSAVLHYQTVVVNWPDTSAARRAARRLELLGVSADSVGRREARTGEGS